MATSWEQRRSNGLFPSADADVPTALELLEWSWYRFARSTEALDEGRIAELLAALPAWAGAPGLQPRDLERRRCAALFLQSATDASSGAALRSAWAAAVDALKVFESQYAWGSKEKATRLAEVGGNERLREAARVAAVGSAVVPLELLAVLAADGSEASADALMPHLERAMSDEAQLEPLARLERYAAKTPPMRAFVELVTTRLERARGAHPVLRLAQSLGIASGPRFRVEVHVDGSRADTALDLHFDSGRPGPAFRGWVQEGTPRSQRPLHQDGGSTACELEALPRSLRGEAKRLGTTWDFRVASTRLLRGKRLATFLGWLEGTVGSGRA